MSNRWRHVLILPAVVLPALVLCAAGAASPIIRRHDRPDSAYVALARRFPAVGTIGRLGAATLIAPDWAISAAHVARGAMTRMPAPSIRFGDESHAIDAVFLHPRWTDLGDHDIALIHLARDVRHAAPMPVYRGRHERGRVAWLVGAGVAGVGNVAQRADDDRLRAATSRIDSASANALFFSFDAPPAGTTLEGAPGAGDSGGPAIVSESGRLFVAGVSSAGFDGASGPASYGAVDVYTRTSTHAKWIDDVLAGKVRPSSMADLAAPPPR